MRSFWLLMISPDASNRDSPEGIHAPRLDCYTDESNHDSLYCMFNAKQLEQYERDGYLILRNQFTESELDELDRAADRHPPMDDGETKQDCKWPEPGRYTLAKSSWSDSAFVRFAEHSTIVNGAKTLLGDDVVLTAYVMYDRTPSGKGLPAHHDYKRWRPVGSSLNWLFTVIPMCDFDESTGQLFIAPGSHHLERKVDRGEGVLHINAAIRPNANDFIDPELNRGDLLFMNMHLWHRAADNNSGIHRRGLFNKYAGKHFPPATGYHVFTDDLYEMFSATGKELLAVHSNKPVVTTRLLLQRTGADGPQYFFVNNGDSLSLPGGPVYFEDAIPDWDIGNYIGALKTNVLKQIRLETPWVTYVGDYEEGDGLCRVYAYPMNSNGFPVPYHEGTWLNQGELQNQTFQFGYEASAIEDWSDPSMVRGKGLSQANCRIDQFAF